jgi:multidrug efflux pump subunit AcrA (membrane-fusion protein)
LVVDVDVEPTGAGAAALTAAPQMVQAHAPPALVSAAAALHAALVANRARHVEEAHRRADADARRAARMSAEVQRRDAAAREKAAARAAIDAELAALQRDKEEQERAIGEIRAVLNAKAATEAESRRQRTQAQQDDTVRQAVADAYAWRDRRTAGGSYEREYRAGFTTLRMVHGTDPVTGRPTDHLEPVEGPPRRLRPCTAEGCELHGKLHYHCRHEAEGAALQLRQLQKAQAKERAAAAAAGVAPALADRPPPYVGCRATGHICATVGFYARPLPDTTAAHFFASAHPTAAQ